MSPQQHEKLAGKIARLDRPGLIRLLRSLRCDFELDFSDDFLNSVNLARLRHIVMAASLHGRSEPKVS